MQKHATGEMPCMQTHSRAGVQVILHLVSLAELLGISAAPFLHVHMVLLDGVSLVRRGGGPNGARGIEAQRLCIHAASVLLGSLVATERAMRSL